MRLRPSVLVSSASLTLWLTLVFLRSGTACDGRTAVLGFALLQPCLLVDRSGHLAIFVTEQLSGQGKCAGYNHWSARPCLSLLNLASNLAPRAVSPQLHALLSGTNFATTPTSVRVGTQTVSCSSSGNSLQMFVYVSTSLAHCFLIETLASLHLQFNSPANYYGRNLVVVVFFSTGLSTTVNSTGCARSRLLSLVSDSALDVDSTSSTTIVRR